MNAYQKKQQQKKRKSIFRKWHRRIGFAAAIFVINLSVTGILLNHYEALDLHKSHISSQWLLELYGVKAPEKITCFQSNELQSCLVDNLLFVNGKLWRRDESSLIGAITLRDANVIATEEHIFLLNQQNILIDEYSTSELVGKSLSAIAQSGNKLILQAGHKSFIFDIGDESMFAYEGVPTVQEATPLSNEEKRHYQNTYRSKQITLLRFVQDLHSGRIIGLSGVIISDIAAIILILLTISGFITWQRRINKPQC